MNSEEHQPDAPNLTRRAFTSLALATAAAAATAGATTASQVLAQTRSRSEVMTMRGMNAQPQRQTVDGRPNAALQIRKALKVGMIGVEGPLEAKFAAAREAGFDGVELDSPGPYKAHEVEVAKKNTGIEVPGVVLSTHWNKPFNHPDPGVRREAADALRTAIRDCRDFGGSTVLVVPAVVNQSMSYVDAYERSQAEIRPMIAIAREHEVAIAFENVWNGFLLSPMEAARYVDELQPQVDHSKRTVGWYFDIGNIVNFGWPEHWIDALGPRIIKLDVKEFSRKRRDDEGLWKGFGVEIGEGDVGWDRVREALRRIGFAGWAAAEVGGGGPDRLKDIARRMDRVFGLKA